MELTGRPSFTVHDSRTHDCGSASFAADALVACALTPTTLSDESSAMRAATLMSGAIGQRDR
jgi:hypothetical protein